MSLRQKVEFYLPRRSAGECWLWIGSTDDDGYGVFKYKGKTVKGHRSAWRVWRGRIPRKKQVLHKCDNPPCGNPDHLFLGTNATNMADMIRKGRGARPQGQANPNCRLTPLQVHAIRADTRSRRQIAESLNISKGTVADIQLRRRWRWLPEESP